MLSAGPEAAPTLLLAHGAGAPMDSAFMEEIARLLAKRGARTLRFEFAYMAVSYTHLTLPTKRIV